MSQHEGENQQNEYVQQRHRLKLAYTSIQFEHNVVVLISLAKFLVRQLELQFSVFFGFWYVMAYKFTNTSFLLNSSQILRTSLDVTFGHCKNCSTGIYP